MGFACPDGGGRETMEGVHKLGPLYEVEVHPLTLYKAKYVVKLH